MRITGYELFAVPPRWLLLKLDTDEGEKFSHDYI